MNPIDLRSDTITQPTPAMREAMAAAQVGDDVLKEDPTVNRLQETAAALLGKEAALFCPSGTMGNLVSVLTHCGRGDEILLGDRSHIFLNEVGGVAAFGGIHPNALPNEEDGTLDLGTLERSIRPEDIHFPPTGLICLENTHNFCGGTPLGLEYMQKVGFLANRHGIPIHLDGARLFNAAVALQVDIKELTSQVDSVMISLSKGLCAPVGSIIASTEEFIHRARKIRKMAGGGMRQAGHLAAAALLALEEQPKLLLKDHQTARKLAEGIASLQGIRVDLERIQTNILFFHLDHPEITPEEFHKILEARQIRIFMIEPGYFRAVTHQHIRMEDIDRVVDFIAGVLHP